MATDRISLTIDVRGVQVMLKTFRKHAHAIGLVGIMTGIGLRRLQLQAARNIVDGRTRHGAVKRQRDGLRAARKREIRARGWYR